MEERERLCKPGGGSGKQGQANETTQKPHKTIPLPTGTQTDLTGFHQLLLDSVNIFCTLPVKYHELCVWSWGNQDDPATAPTPKDFMIKQAITCVNQLLRFSAIKFYVLGT